MAWNENTKERNPNVVIHINAANICSCAPVGVTLTQNNNGIAQNAKVVLLLISAAAICNRSCLGIE
jgi:hypothetical protein